MIVSHELAKMLLLLVDRLAQRPNWRNYSFVEDMKCEALIQLCKVNNPVPNLPPERWDRRPNCLKFDFSYSDRTGKSPNPFAYLTQVVSNAFRRTVKLEQALASFRDDVLVEEGMTPSHRRQAEMEANRSSEPIQPKVKPRAPRARKAAPT